MKAKYKLTEEYYIEDDGWINQKPGKVIAEFKTRKEAEQEHGRFYDRLPKGQTGQTLIVKALWRLDRGEVVGYKIR